MKVSKLFLPTLREAPSDAEVISHKLLLRAGYIRKLASGIYTYLPLGLKVIENISRIVRDEMKAVGAQELLMPMVLPAELWFESGRWEHYGKELLRFKDRHDHDYCLGPTHEEIITDLVRREVRSYRQLPMSLYQIQTKFRDEIRPRFGLMRGREFMMKDCYSFDVDEKTSIESYWRYYEAYKKIFTRCGLKYRAVEAATGVIGGTLSHEFQVLADSGEDAIVSCTQCNYAANIEKAEFQVGDKCGRCSQGVMESHRGIEVGQVFYLGTKYSEALKANYLDAAGQSQTIVMGCYGIGIGRTAAAAVEQNHDDKGIIWPVGLAPFATEVISLGTDAKVIEAAEKIYQELNGQKIETLWDDRDERAGVKLNDADLIGMPWQIVVGNRGLEKGEVEIKNRSTHEKSLCPLGAIVARLKEQLS